MLSRLTLVKFQFVAGSRLILTLTLRKIILWSVALTAGPVLSPIMLKILLLFGQGHSFAARRPINFPVLFNLIVLIVKLRSNNLRVCRPGLGTSLT